MATANPTKEQIEVASKTALLRSRSHLKGAEALAKRRRFALAYSILVLSLEELAKAIVLKLAADSLISFDIKDKGTDRYFDPTLLFRGKESHRTKQEVSLGILLQVLAVIRSVELFVEINGRKPTKNEINQVIVAAVFPRQVPPDYAIGSRLVSKRDRVRRELTKLGSSLPKLEALKQKGFYTDLAPYSTLTSGVKAPNAANYHHLHETLELLTDLGNEVVRSKTNKDDFEKLLTLRRLRDFGFTHA